jgi:hypothetical protein
LDETIAYVIQNREVAMRDAIGESDRQPPQAIAPLWANRRHDGRPRIVEKWKR